MLLRIRVNTIYEFTFKMRGCKVMNKNYSKEKELNKRINIRFAIIYFVILISFQLLVFILIAIYGLNIVTLLLVVLSTTLLPVILGFILIKYFKKKVSSESVDQIQGTHN